MLSPKKIKFRKSYKGKITGQATSGNTIAFGFYGLQALEGGRITSRQIEATRVAMTRAIKRGGQVWIRIFPDRPITKKAAETRMGSGKGALDHWAANIYPAKILFEIEGCVSRELVENAFALAAAKLPIKTKIVSKAEYLWENA
jgi:large subunit ribosomal protein L16